MGNCAIKIDCRGDALIINELFVYIISKSGNRQTNQEDVCMALSSFIVGMVVILIILVISCIMTALLCVKIRSATVGTESIYPPSSTYHAFSSSASKA